MKRSKRPSNLHIKLSREVTKMMADGSPAIPFLEFDVVSQRGEPGSSGRSGTWNCGLTLTGTSHQNSAFQGKPTRVSTEAPRPQP